MAEGKDTNETKPDFSGNWVLDRNDNFEAFMAANGANWVFRKMASKSRPKLEIQQKGDKFSIKLTTIMATREENFNIDEEFEQDSHSGVRMKITPSWDGVKLVTKSRPVKEGEAKPNTITREITGEGPEQELVMTFYVDDVISKRIFKRAP